MHLVNKWLCTSWLFNQHLPPFRQIRCSFIPREQISCLVKSRAENEWVIFASAPYTSHPSFTTQQLCLHICTTATAATFLKEINSIRLLWENSLLYFVKICSVLCFRLGWCFVGVAVSVVSVSLTTWISGRELHFLCHLESLPARLLPLRQKRSQSCLDDWALFLRWCD